MDNYFESFVEVDEVLNHFSPQMLEKIPSCFLNFIKENKDKDYKWVYNENVSIDNQKLSKGAILILVCIYLDYIANSEEKNILEKVLFENEKISEREKAEKYSSDNIFQQNKTATNSENDNVEQNDEILNVEKMNIIQKILIKIRKKFMNKKI